MPKEQSPYPEKTSLKRLQLVRQELAKYGRDIRIFAGKRNGHVMLIEGGSMMGPFANWKARWVMEQMLDWCKKHMASHQAAQDHVRRLVAEDRLFITAS
jgi:hypothetical protein